MRIFNIVFICVVATVGIASCDSVETNTRQVKKVDTVLKESPKIEDDDFSLSPIKSGDALGTGTDIKTIDTDTNVSDKLYKFKLVADPDSKDNRPTIE